jgi:hypothetical protein
MLSLTGVAATDAGLAEIAKLTTLQSLRIGPMRWFDKDAKGPLPVTDVGLAHLTTLKGLTSLDLSLLQVTDKGLGTLASFPDLRELELSKLAITGNGLSQLSDLKKLNSVTIQDCSALKREDFEALHRAKPSLRIDVFNEGRQLGLLQSDTVQWYQPVKP